MGHLYIQVVLKIFGVSKTAKYSDVKDSLWPKENISLGCSFTFLYSTIVQQFWDIHHILEIYCTYLTIFWVIKANTKFEILVCWVVLANLIQTIVICGKETSVKELPLSDWPVVIFVKHFLDCGCGCVGRPSPLWVISLQGRQSWEYKKAEQAMWSK